MSRFEFVKDYKNNERLRGSFNALAKRTFGIDFEAWYQRGYWGEAYCCYSFVVDHQVVSNVSTNVMNIHWGGNIYKALQIGTVMTDENYRGKGVAQRLLEKVMDEWEDRVDFIYLFANDRALSLYKRLNMIEYQEYEFTSAIPEYKEQEEVRRLDLENINDYNLFMDLAQNRVAQSEGIGVEGDIHLIMFYCYEDYADKLYYIEDRETVVAYKEEGNQLVLLDIFSKEKQDIREILSLLPRTNSSHVAYPFRPHMDELEVKSSKRVVENGTLLIKSKEKINSGQFRFPPFSHA